MRNALIAAALLLAPAAPAAAHEVKAGAVAVVHPVMRASIGRTPNAAAYFTLRNSGPTADRLLSASCACAAKVEVHTMSMANGTMIMRPAGAVTVPAKGQVAFAPGGLHLMLTGLKGRAEAGTTLPLVLRFERAGSVTVPVFVTANVEAEIAKHAGDHGPAPAAAAHQHH